jgi:hypothetical protein
VGPTSPLAFKKTLGGQVVDANTGAPLPAAAVAVEDPFLATTADANGVFSFEGVEKDVVVVRALFPGYVPTTRRADVLEDAKRALSMRLQPIGTIEQFKNGVVNTFIDGSARLTIFASTLQRDDGSAVTDEVEVELTYMSPSSLAAPGAFDDAVTIGGAFVSVESFGVVSIDVFEGGVPVQLAPGATADLEIVLPAAAPGRFSVNDSIALWDFDEVTATWIEIDRGFVQRASDGSGALAWLARVPHFSFWSAALVIADSHCLTGFVESDGEPLAGAEVAALGQSFGGTRISFTDVDGAYHLHVPAGSSLRVETRINGSSNATESRKNLVVPNTIVDCGGTNGTSGTPTVLDFAVTLDGCVSGFILDHSGFPVSAATVALVPGETVLTSADGFFCGRSVAGSTVLVTTPGFASVKAVSPLAGSSCAADDCAVGDVFDELPQSDDLVGTIEFVRSAEAAEGASDASLTACGTFLAGDVDVLLGLIDQGNSGVESCEVVDLVNVAGCLVRTDICVMSDDGVEPVDLSDIAPVDAGGFIQMLAANNDFADLLPGDPLADLPFEAGIYLPEVDDLDGLGFLSGPLVNLFSFGGAGIGGLDVDIELPGDIKVTSPDPKSLNIDRRLSLVVSWTPSPGPNTLFIEICSSVLIDDDPMTFEDICIEKEVNASLGSFVIPGAAMAELHDPQCHNGVDHFFCMFRFAEGEISVPLLRTAGQARVRVSADNELFASEFVPGGARFALAKQKDDKTVISKGRHEEFFRTRMRRRKARTAASSSVSP